MLRAWAHHDWVSQTGLTGGLYDSIRAQAWLLHLQSMPSFLPDLPSRALAPQVNDGNSGSGQATSNLPVASVSWPGPLPPLGSPQTSGVELFSALVGALLLFLPLSRRFSPPCLVNS